MIISSFLSPYSKAFLSIYSACSTLFSTVSGMPSSFNAKAITAAPYFLAIGSILSSFSSSALTELIIDFPLYTLSPASIASGFDESICKGTDTIPCKAFTTSIISKTSSAPGTPTLTSKISAPHSSSSKAILLM